MNILTLLKFLPALIALLHQAVLFVEQAFPKAGSGAQKFDAVLSMVSAALPTVGATADQVTTLISAARGLISPMVAALNAGGVFTSSQPIQQPDNRAT